MERVLGFRKIFWGLASLVLCLVVACGEVRQENDPSLALKVYQGIEVSPVEFPAIVRVNVYSLRGVSTCSGTVIGERAILTAAHCFESSNIFLIEVNVAGVDYQIEELVVAPGYSSNDVALFADVAVLRSVEPLPVAPLPVLVSVPVLPHYPLMIFGYGLNEEGEAGVLRKGVIYPDLITPNHIIDYVDGGQNTCAGDSGGPLVSTVAGNAAETSASTHERGVVGVTSSGDGKACTNRETAYYINLQNDELLQFLISTVSDLVLL